MGQLYARAFKNKWLGQPATASGVVPASAGAPFPVRANYLRLTNHLNAAQAMAAVALLLDSKWKCFSWRNATTTATDQTAAAQNGTTNDVALDASGTPAVNDGFLISADLPFGALSVDVTTAGAGNTPAAAHTISYWNGSAYTAIPTSGTLIDIPRASDWATGEQTVLFIPPVDWAVGGSGTNVPQDKYNLLIQRSAFPTAARVDALARRIYVGIPLVTDILAAGAVAQAYSERFGDEFVLAGWAAALGVIQGTPSTIVAVDSNSLELLLI